MHDTTPRCTIDGCTRLLDARGWCSTHWRRWRLYGHPLALKPKKTIAEKIEARVQRDLVTGCWRWTGILNNKGYGQLYVNVTLKRQLAHRLAYEEFVGPIPDGLVIDHLCRNRACVNPDHLEAVTFAENVRRGDAVKTHCPQGHEYTPENTGQGHGGSKRCLACHRERQREYNRRKKIGSA